MAVMLLPFAPAVFKVRVPPLTMVPPLWLLLPVSVSAAVPFLIKVIAPDPLLTTAVSIWAAAFVKGMLCNWMVTLGAVLALVSRSTIGKIVAMWLPIATFFAHRYWDFDAQQYAAQMSNFWKNMTIIGGLLMVACFGPGPISVDKV